MDEEQKPPSNLGRALVTQNWLATELARVSSRFLFFTERHNAVMSRVDQWVREEVQPALPDVARRFFSIVANGTADHAEHPKWATEQALHKHRAEMAEAVVLNLTRQVKSYQRAMDMAVNHLHYLEPTLTKEQVMLCPTGLLAWQDKRRLEEKFGQDADLATRWGALQARVEQLREKYPTAPIPTFRRYEL